MLKTNSKKARENIRRYIVDNTCNDNGDLFPDFTAARDYIMQAYEDYTRYDSRLKKYPYLRFTFVFFLEFVQGLPSGLPFDYFYYPAVPVLGAILEETPEEQARFTESQAEELFTRLIYRELMR